jgi:hypothetical protein
MDIKNSIAFAFLAVIVWTVLPGCGCPLETRETVVGEFFDIVVGGQDLYPSRPPWDEHYTYSISKGGAGDWDCQLTMVRSPKDIKGTCWGIMKITIRPPYCQEDDIVNWCAHAWMYQFIAGPKRKGEVYQVQHTTVRFEPLPPADPPGVHLGWEEEGWGFPDYRSVSVTGTVEVLSERPFRLAYDVVFLDEADNRREVTMEFEPRYFTGTYCRD